MEKENETYEPHKSISDRFMSKVKETLARHERELWESETVSAGLSEEQACSNRKLFGKNIMKVPEETSALYRVAGLFLHRRWGLYSIPGAACIFLVGLAFMWELGTARDPIIVLLFLSFFALIIWGILKAVSVTNRHQLEQIVRAYNVPVTVRVAQDGEVKEIPHTELVVGDVVFLYKGDRILADGQLLASSHLKVIETQLSGEDRVVEKDAAAFTPHCVDLSGAQFVLYGSYVAEGYGTYRVARVGNDTVLMQALLLLMGYQSH